MNRREYIISERIRVFNIKIELEKMMRNDLKRYFSRQKTLVRRGQNYESIEPVLRKHYKRIVKRLLRVEKKQGNRNVVADRVRQEIERKAIQRAQIIDIKTGKDIEAATQEAQAELLKQGIENPTEAQLLLVASRIFKRKSDGRVSTIATTETQNVAEGTRNTIVVETHKEMEQAILFEDEEYMAYLVALSGDYTSMEVAEGYGEIAVVALLAMLATAQKVWQTMGDDRVRDGDPYNHRIALGQKVPKNAPFIVSNEMLMYPGDTDMGATAGNVANCRCVVIYL